MSRILIFSYIALSILSIIFGFLANEDLSTGGSTFDFKFTLNAVKGFSVGLFEDYSIYTKHFPLHYIILSLVYGVVNDEFILRIFYLAFSSLLPIFFYLNLRKIYGDKKTNIILISFSLLFLPYFRSSAIWANSHLTALIFLLIANYFYLNSFNKNIHYKLINLFFLALATYSIQSYVIFYLFYLFKYYKNSSTKQFIFILFFCSILSIPGFIFIFSNFGARSLYGLNFTHNIAYSLIANFSIIFFYFCFFNLNKENLLIIKDVFFKIKKGEFFILLILFFTCIYFYSNTSISLPIEGRGFFYKLSILIFKNNLLFFLTSFLGMLTSFMLIKKEFELIYIIFFVNIMSLHFVVYQKYFEPILILLIFILFKNFLSKNIININRNTIIFISIIFVYFLAAKINDSFGFTKNIIYTLQ